MNDSPYDFNIAILKTLDLDPDKVASYMLVGDGDGVTINVEWVPDDWHLDAPNEHRRYRLYDIESARLHLAWLMWCWREGYTAVVDRAGMENWLLEDPETLHPDDQALRPQLLAMADEILAARP